jgi:sugar phosphate isomerase/epimerase
MNRRRFLAGGAGLAAASFATPRLGGPAQAAAPALRTGLFGAERIGIQLYSVADQVSSIGFAKVLAEVAAIGYKRVEFAGYTQGTTPEITLKELRRLLDDNGLTPIGSHVSPSDDDSMKRILEEAAVLGIPNVGISLPLPGDGPTVAGWTSLSKTYNRFGEMAAEQGVGFYLHNHFHEWFPTDDPNRRGEDILLAETDPRYVFFEMDVYWAHVGQWQSGQVQHFDPLRDYAIPFRDRYKLFHVKDGKKDTSGGYTDAFNDIADAGQGSIDFQAFFTELFAQSPDEVGKHFYIWERDNASSHPCGSLAAARASFTYIRHGLVGKPATQGPGAVVGGVVAAVTGVAVKRTKTGRRVLRVTIQADEPVSAAVELRRGRRLLARRRSDTLAAGRHVLQLRVPSRAAAGRARLDVGLGAQTTRLAVHLPRRRRALQSGSRE